jgi:hypothetical protein
MSFRERAGRATLYSLACRAGGPAKELTMRAKGGVTGAVTRSSGLRVCRIGRRRWGWIPDQYGRGVDPEEDLPGDTGRPMSRENVKVIRRIYDPMARGDFWAAGGFFDADTDLSAPSRRATPSRRLKPKR